MTKELVISSNRHETKVALLEDDQLVEIFFQRSNEYSLVGSIHKGRVTRVLPGMQSAFVDLGLERDAFLYVSDFLEQTGEDYERVAAGEEPPRTEQQQQQQQPKGEQRGGGGRRGDRDRDRGGNRGGNTDRGDRPPARQAMLPVAPVAPVEAVVAFTPIAEAAPVSVEEGAPVAAGTEEAAGAQPGQDRGGDRRGRGRRRRRRGGRGPAAAGMPDSKFAAPGEQDDAAEGDDETPESAVAADESSPALAPPVEERRAALPVSPVVPVDLRYARVAADEPEPFVLPGESIAKYRSAPPRPEPIVPAAVVAPPAPAPVVVAQPAPAPVAPPVVEDVPVDDPDEEEAEVRELVAEHVESHERAIASAEAAADSEGGESDDDDEDEEEGEDQASAEDEVDALQEAAEAALASGEEPSAPVASEAGVREEQTTARFVQRRDRGRRRGGRNGERSSGGGGDRDRTRSGGGERYESVPRADNRTVTGPAPAEAQATASATARPERERIDRPRERERPVVPSISDLLKEGQEIIVQIYKEPLGTKGARITSHVAMPGRYVVFMPTADHHGVSRKLGDDEERHRLKRIVQSNSQGMVGGFIVRTAGEGKPEADIASDMSNLYNQWLDIRKKAEKRRAPCLLHSDLELVTRTLRDQVNDQYKAIWTDSEEMYEMMVGFLELFQPALVSRVKMYSREAPIFDTFNITSELEKALRPKVWLKSGGYIVINQTEALVAIDINTGKFVGKSNRLEDTIVKTNVEAVKEIVRQIRLRDLGGIIVVDFIDMEERKNRQKVMQALEEAMAQDRAPYKILQFNDFGLVAITRRRVKQSLERALCSPCPTCEGAGYVKSVQTVMSEILTEALKIRPGLEGNNVMLRVNPEVAKTIKTSAETYLQELEDLLGRAVIVKSDPLLHPDKFDLA